MHPPTPTKNHRLATKARTFVLAAGAVVARQFYDSSLNEVVSWELADASGQSIRMTNATGGYTDVDSGGAELDALGNNVGIHGSLSDPRNSEGEVSPANRSPISAEALCDKGGVAGPCWLVNMINRGQTMGSKGSDLPIEMLGDSHPASLSRHPFYFAFYRNSFKAAEDDGRWIKTDWDVIYDEVFLGYNDKGEVQYRIDIIGTISNTMTFIPPTSLPGPEGAQCPDPPCEGLGRVPSDGIDCNEKLLTEVKVIDGSSNPNNRDKKNLPWINSSIYPQFQGALDEINERIGPIGFSEMFRDRKRQEYLWGEKRAGRIKYAARPGYSNHESGFAFDIPERFRLLKASNGETVEDIFVRHGFLKTVPGDEPHFAWKDRPVGRENTALNAKFNDWFLKCIGGY